jgi:DNA-binding PadR family transcriptional regulator
MGFKHFVLGYFADSPAYGYELIKKCFMDFVPVNPELNEGRLYATLSKLENEAMIERTIRPQAALPNQKITHITPRGREVFLDWLDSGEDEENNTKFDFFKQYTFLSKVNYYKHMPDQKALAKFQEQLELSERRLQHFGEAREAMIRKDVNWYRIKIIEYGIETEKVKIAWLKELIAELDKPAQD